MPRSRGSRRAALLLGQALPDPGEAAGQLALRALRERLELDVRRRQALQHAVVQVARETHPFGHRRVRLGLAAQEMVFEIDAHAQRDEAGEKQIVVAGAAPVEQEHPAAAERQAERRRQGIADLEGLPQLLVEEGGRGVPVPRLRTRDREGVPGAARGDERPEAAGALAAVAQAALRPQGDVPGRLRRLLPHDEHAARLHQRRGVGKGRGDGRRRALGPAVGPRPGHEPGQAEAAALAVRADIAEHGAGHEQVAEAEHGLVELAGGLARGTPAEEADQRREHGRQQRRRPQRAAPVPAQRPGEEDEGEEHEERARRARRQVNRRDVHGVHQHLLALARRLPADQEHLHPRGGQIEPGHQPDRAGRPAGRHVADRDAEQREGGQDQPPRRPLRNAPDRVRQV
nr:hypothetical protein [Caldovatus aquaticus]